MTPESQFDLPQTSFAVLGMLSFQPMSGYDLKQFADKSIGHFYWSPAKSQIYAELRRLTKAGLVTEEHVEQEARPDKRMYALTPTGRAELKNWVDNSDFEQDVFKSNLMLRMFFGSTANPESLIQLLRQNLDFEIGRLAELEQMENQCVAAGPDTNAMFSLLTIRGGIHITRAGIAWSKESIKALEQRTSDSPNVIVSNLESSQ